MKVIVKYLFALFVSIKDGFCKVYGLLLLCKSAKAVKFANLLSFVELQRKNRKKRKEKYDLYRKQKSLRNSIEMRSIMDYLIYIAEVYHTKSSWCRGY